MARGCWTTPPQRKWLDEYLPEWTAAQAASNTKAFHSKVYSKWHKTFPDPPTDEEVAAAGGDKQVAEQDKRSAVEGRIYQWFYNHTRMVPTQRDTINLQKHARVGAVWQVYQKLYYKTRVKRFVDAAYEEYLKSDKVTEEISRNPKLLKKERLHIQNRVVREMYEKETDDIKAEVVKYRDQQRDGGIACEEPEELQKNIKLLPGTLASCIKTLHKKTGWMFTILAGGPTPRQGGKISTVILNSESTKDDVDFQDHMGAGEWKEFVACWDEFLHDIYPEDARAARALSNSTSPEPHEDAGLSSDAEDDAAATVTTKASSSQSVEFEYEREKRENIARNKAILAEVFERNNVRPSDTGSSKKGRTKKKKGKAPLSPTEVNSDLEDPSRGQKEGAREIVTRSRKALAPTPVADVQAAPAVASPTSLPSSQSALALRNTAASGANDPPSDTAPPTVVVEGPPLDALASPTVVVEGPPPDAPASPTVAVEDLSPQVPGSSTHTTVSSSSAPPSPPVTTASDDMNVDKGVNPSSAPPPSPPITAGDDMDVDKGVNHHPLPLVPQTFADATTSSTPTNTSPSVSPNDKDPEISKGHNDGASTTADNSSVPMQTDTRTDVTVNASTDTKACEDGPLPTNNAPVDTLGGVQSLSVASPPPLIVGKAPAGTTIPDAHVGIPESVLQDLPAFIRDGEAYLRSISTPSKVWGSLIINWVRFEQACKTKGNVPAQKRPPEIGGWQKRHRKFTYKPTIRVSEYMGAFREWWKTLQPPNRDMSSKGPPPRDLPDNSDWSKLCYSGRNGFFLIMMGLSWWAHAATSPDLVPEFDSMAEDVNWALGRMLRLMPSNPAKRSHSELIDDEQVEEQPKKRATPS